MDHRNRTPAVAGALAAGLLLEACRMAPGKSLGLGLVGDLALDLERRLDALSRSAAEEDPVEAALACADLATLGACNLSELPPDGERLARAAVYLAAGTTRALVALAEVLAGDPDDAHAANVLRDLRSALWKADLAVRQLAEPRSAQTPG
jgi:hypothetical protein